MACNTNALSGKVVINICDAKRLGHICNYEIDLCDGRISAVFVPSKNGFLNFSRNNDIRIPWDRIKKIGEDAILVEVLPRPSECTAPSQKKHRFR